jgi:hypothetical protein
VCEKSGALCMRRDQEQYVLGEIKSIVVEESIVFVETIIL